MSQELGSAELGPTDQSSSARAASTGGGAALERRLEHVDGLVERLETGSDPVSAATARELVQILMELHGTALARIVTLVNQHGATGDILMRQFCADPLVRSLLLLYDLHPVDVETRVREAVDHARDYVSSHGGAVEVVNVEVNGQASAHVRVQGAASLSDVVKNAVREAAPDLDSIVVEHQEPVVTLTRRR